ncbi:MAG: hypothetical protein WDZ63_00575 [Burkholderiales bacterium]
MSGAARLVAHNGNERALLRWTALGGVALMFLVLTTSGYMRLVASGFGCEDWPECYGVQAQEELRPLHRIARPLHRLAASGMGAVAILAVGLAWVQKPRRRGDLTIATAVIVLTIFLAVLGRMAKSFGSPSVILGNVAAGTVLLLLLWWLYLRARSRQPEHPDRRTAGSAAVALSLGLAYFALNVVAYAHHVVLACPTLAECGAVWRGPDLVAFNPLIALEAQLEPAAADAARQALGLAQRLSPVLLLVAAGGVVLQLSHTARSLRILALFTSAVALAQAAVATFGIRPDFPFAMVLAHDLLGIAVLMLLAALAYATSGRDAFPRN